VSGNRDTAVAERYWDETCVQPMAALAKGTGREGGPDEPRKVKSYPGRRPLLLPQRLPTSLGSVEAAITGSAPPAPAGALADPAVVGGLLYFGYGLSRVDVGAVNGWPHHRLVPSARCFYPTELYVVDAAGVHHYDHAHHGLVPLRAGDHRGHLGAALGGADAPLYLVLTSHFWKTAFRYRHYAYRLCTQEAGMVAGNLMLVAGAAGLRTRVHYQFLDESVDHLLGLQSGEERTVAVLAVGGSGGAGPAAPARDAAELNAAIPALDAPSVRAPGDRDLAADTYTVDAASVLRTTAELAASWPGAPQPAPAGVTAPTGLVAALRGRHSGGTLFRPAARPVDGPGFRAALGLATAPYDSDVGPGPRAAVHAIVQFVDGVEPGVYRAGADGLHRTGDLPRGRLADAVVQGPPVVDLERTPAVCYAVSDRFAATSALGNRGYRVAHLDAGIVAQRLCVLASAAGGVAARPFNGYARDPVARALGLTEPGATPMFQIALGHRVPTAQYEMGLVF
jgi:SagB-type dehydrogenase family enzyme